MSTLIFLISFGIALGVEQQTEMQVVNETGNQTFSTIDTTTDNSLNTSSSTEMADNDTDIFYDDTEIRSTKPSNSKQKHSDVLQHHGKKDRSSFGLIDEGNPIHIYDFHDPLYCYICFYVGNASITDHCVNNRPESRMCDSTRLDLLNYEDVLEYKMTQINYKCLKLEARNHKVPTMIMGCVAILPDYDICSHITVYYDIVSYTDCLICDSNNCNPGAYFSGGQNFVNISCMFWVCGVLLLLGNK